MRIVNLEQGSSDWLKWRDKGIGSSDAAILWYGEQWGRTPLELWREKVGISQGRKVENSAMARGKRLEPEARAMYEQLVGHNVPAVCAIHDVWEWCKASLDGWHERARVCVEIKCPNKYDHKDALEGRVPAKYKPQVDHQLLVSGARLCHYVSYGSYLFTGVDRFAVVEYARDEARIQKLAAIEQLFWHHVFHKTPLSEWQAQPAE